MIVNCPHCHAQYQVGDQHFVAGDVSLKCPRCQKAFRATASHLAGVNPSLPPTTAPIPRAAPQPVPAPVPPPVPGAVPGGGPISGAGLNHHASAEWDAMMSGSNPAPATSSVGSVLDDFLPAELQSSMQSPGQTAAQASLPPQSAQAPQALAPRDPFYESNPWVVEQPPADAPSQTPRRYQVQLASGGAAPSLPPMAVPEPAMMAQSLPPQSPAPAMIAASLPPQAATSPSSMLPGLIHHNAATTAAESRPTAGTIASSRSLSDPFANISLTVGKDQPVAGDGAGDNFAAQPLKTGVALARIRAETFPPRPAAPPADKENTRDAGSGLLDKLLLIAATVVLVFSGLFAAWQFEKLPGEPGLTLSLANLIDARSPLQVNDPTPVALLIESGQAAEKQAALANAVSYYQQALRQDPKNSEAQDSLRRCLKELGDQRALRDQLD